MLCVLGIAVRNCGEAKRTPSKNEAFKTMTDEPKADNHDTSRRKFLLLSAVGGLAAASLATETDVEAQEINCAPVSGSVAWKQKGNNEHVRALQTSADHSGGGELHLDYFGHTAFRLTTPAGLSLLFDPWRNDPSGAWGLWFPADFPRIVVDLALSTHTHFDHDAIDKVDATSVLDRFVGKFSFADVEITGVADKHATDQPGSYKWIEAVKESGADPYPPNNPGHLDNVTYLVESAGIRTLIWGDNRAKPPEDVWKRWGRVDVLTLPVDGSEHVLSFEQGNEIVERLKPKIVIPTHYLQKGVSSALSTLQAADSWVNAQKRKRNLAESRLVLTADSIKDYDREFFYFGNSARHGQ
ncbi:MBL fold metallo-hydrolase [Mesorhizobium kowhaii]|uniref:Zn-dependent hydrolase n=1 Tax=Mesorhizobium kowhaii TaxID=1300272 RepID=A0A2W7CYC2_9HYPH|nr:MBL fold metallo-hydrolase [Mesorhizobium kowhaii]PZV38809.1 hypothetical protein B5V02_09140 [Mesorhizobium kowhaii]